MNTQVKWHFIYKIICALVCLLLCTYLISCGSKSIVYNDTTIIVSQAGMDRTDEFEAILKECGFLKLGEGEFIVNDLKMPANSYIEGIGRKTVIKTLNLNTSAIELSSNCRLDNLCIEGSDAIKNDTSSACGVVIDGNEYKEEKGHIIISRCYIKDFGKAGIFGLKTGYECEDSVSVINCEIENCGTGISIGPHFEYGRYTNVLVHNNKIGCINDGGNNNFVNCTFTKNDTAFSITENQMNGGHGSCVSCTFNHNKDGYGLAISIAAVNNAFIFSACNIWFGGIDINSSKGIMFNSCIIGEDVPISGTTQMVAFNDCTFRDLPNCSGEGFIFKDCCLFSGEAI